MVDLNLLLHGFTAVLSGYNLVALVLGSFFGIIIGAIPGLTATMGSPLLVPFAFGMTPITGIVMLLGIYTGAIYGGGIASILIKTPGTPAAAATVFDGYPMAQAGVGRQALGAGTLSSGLGGHFRLGGPAPGDGRPRPDGRVPAVHVRVRRADRWPVLCPHAHRFVRSVRGLPSSRDHLYGAAGERRTEEHPA